MALYRLFPEGVFKGDKLTIPNNIKNRHWREYQEWLAAGNTPDPDETPPPLTAKQKAESTINNNVFMSALVTVIGNLATPSKTKAQMITLIKAKIT